MSRRIHFLLVLCSAIALAIILVNAALAQAAATAPVVQTPDWLNYVAVIAVAVTMALVGWGIAIFNKKAGLENNATAMQIEAHARDLLQSALTNLAGRVIMQLGPKINEAEMSIRNPTIRAAALALPNLANDALNLFPSLKDPNVVAQKIVDKIGVLTAANPVSVPTQKTAPPAAA
jgi:hypothetical protein